MFQTAHGNFLILSHPNINFLISKQNRAPKTHSKMLNQQAGTAILNKHVFQYKHV